MTCNYRWFDKETGEIASLRESVFYGSMIVMASTQIMALSIGYSKLSDISDDTPDGSFNAAEIIAVLASISSIISAIVMACSGTLLRETCDFRKVSKEEQTEQTNAKGLSFVDRLNMVCCRKGQAQERDNSSEEGSKTGVYGFLRRLNIIKNLNLVERFSKKNPEKDYLLREFRGGENFSSGKERERFMQKSSGSGYNTIDML